MTMIDMGAVDHRITVALALANFALCSAIGWACLCRVAVMSCESTRAAVRASYSLLMVAAGASGLAPVLWREWPGPGQLAMTLAVLVWLGRTKPDWRGGVPPHARRF